VICFNRHLLRLISQQTRSIASLAMQQLVRRLLDPRCVTVLSFFDWSLVSGRDAHEWMLPIFRESPELVNWEALCEDYKLWMRKLVTENAHRFDWQRQSSSIGKDKLQFYHDHADHIDGRELCHVSGVRGIVFRDRIGFAQFWRSTWINWIGRCCKTCECTTPHLPGSTPSS
jgi:hypothetical protein